MCALTVSFVFCLKKLCEVSVLCFELFVNVFCFVTKAKVLIDIYKPILS